jgi:hypothetical protein
VEPAQDPPQASSPVAAWRRGPAGARADAPVSVPREERLRPSEAVAGFIAAASIAASVVAIIYHPLIVAPFTMGVALIAAGLGGRFTRLAAAAVAVAGICWFLGMMIAVLADNPIY